MDFLIGDAAKAKGKLGWEPRTKFKQLVRLMVDAEIELAQREAATLNFQQARSSAHF